jgi:hypothetical protein
MVEPEGPQMTSQYGAYELYAGISKFICIHTHADAHDTGHNRGHAHTHSHIHTQKYVIVVAFPRQHWVRERVSVLHYTYIASLVFYRILILGFYDRRGPSLLHGTH